MRLLALAAGVALSAGALLASTDFANIRYNGTKLDWGAPCDTVGAACPGTGLFQYVGGMHNLPPYDSAMNSTFTYDWEPVGPATKNVDGSYDEYLTGYFVFSYGATNLLTVDFRSAHAALLYQPITGDLALYLNSTTSAGIAPIFTSDILTFAPLTDWSMTIDFGKLDPGVGNNGYIKGFPSKWNSFTVGADPYPAGQVPEPASMLMAGVGLLSMGGLLSLRKRLRK